MSTEKKPAATRTAQDTPPAANATHAEWLAYVREKIEGTKFGSLQIVVHDGKVMQVEATEKVRLPPRPTTSEPPRALPPRVNSRPAQRNASS